MLVLATESAGSTRLRSAANASSSLLVVVLPVLLALVSLARSGVQKVVQQVIQNVL